LIRVRIEGSSVPVSQATLVRLAPLNTVIGPTEFLGLAGTPTLIANLTSATEPQSAVTIENRSPFTIFWCYGVSATVTPTLTTANGIDLAAGSYLTLDAIGAMAVWQITGTTQTAGNGTRVTGGYRV